MPRRVAAESARETLVTKLANGETNAPSGDSTSEPSARQRHIELVRAAGRAALEESLQSGPSGMKRKASEMTAAGIAAQWQAYAEVYGTNGMAAGGGRSSLVEPPGPSPNVPRVQSTEAVGEDEGEVKAEAEAEADAVESAVTATEAEAEAGGERVVLSGHRQTWTRMTPYPRHRKLVLLPPPPTQRPRSMNHQLYPAEELCSTSRREGSPSGTFDGRSEGVERRPRAYLHISTVYVLR